MQPGQYIAWPIDYIGKYLLVLVTIYKGDMGWTLCVYRQYWSDGVMEQKQIIHIGTLTNEKLLGLTNWFWYQLICQTFKLRLSIYPVGCHFLAMALYLKTNIRCTIECAFIVYCSQAPLQMINYLALLISLLISPGWMSLSRSLVINCGAYMSAFQQGQCVWRLDYFPHVIQCSSIGRLRLNVLTDEILLGLTNWF